MDAPLLLLLYAVDSLSIDRRQPAELAPPPAAIIEVAATEPEIVVKARKHSAADPIEAINVKAFAVTQAVDDTISRPVALAYKRNLPEPARDGLRNFLKNLSEPVVFVNFVLQHKVGKAGETLGRFALNSTFGAGGVFDVAKRKPFNLPRRTNGFAYTMGFYGVKPGAYIFLPIVGPTTVRDMIGAIADRMLLPVGIGYPFTELAYSAPVGAVSAVDRRAEFDDDLEAIRASSDPYASRREFYLRKRQREIDALHGKTPPVLADQIASERPERLAVNPG